MDSNGGGSWDWRNGAAVALLVALVWLCLLAADRIVRPAHSAEPTRIPCWQVEAFVKAHGGDRDAARRSALARGFTRDDLRDAERRCLK